MMIEYNKIAEQTEDEHPNCEMRAMWGDLIQGQEPVDEVWASDVEFDLIAMSVRDSPFLSRDSVLPFFLMELTNGKS